MSSTGFPSLDRFLGQNKEILSKHTQFQKGLKSFCKRTLVQLDRYTENGNVELLYKYRPPILCPKIARMGMFRIIVKNGEAIDPPLIVIGNLQKERKLSYFFVWDHDTPLGVKINVEEVQIKINSKGQIRDVCCYFHFRKRSLLKRLGLRTQELPPNWYISFRPGTHGPTSPKEGYGYSEYAVFYFDFKNEGRNGEIFFHKSLLDLDGTHGWKFPEIWVPMWICCYRDLVQNGSGSYSCPHSKFEDFFTGKKNRKRISKYSLLAYNLEKQMSEGPRPIEDADLLYPL